MQNESIVTKTSAELSQDDSANIVSDTLSEKNAKELLWEHLEPHSREIILYMAKNNKFKADDELLVGFKHVGNRTLSPYDKELL